MLAVALGGRQDWPRSPPALGGRKCWGRPEGGREGGRKSLERGWICCVDSGEGHRTDRRSERLRRINSREIPFRRAAGPLLSPSSDTARSRRSRHAHLCDPESSAHLWTPQPRGSRAPASTPPSPPKKVAKCNYAESSSELCQATDVCGGVLRKALLLPNCS